MDRRTILAVTLSLAVWYGWLLMFPPPEPVPEDAGGDVVAEQVEPQADPDAVPDAVPAVAPVPEAPVRSVDVELCRARMQVTTRDGAIHNLVLLDHEAAYQVDPLYSWVLRGFTNGFSEPWKPYGEAPGHEVLLGADAGGFVAGAGPVDAPGPRVEVVSTSPTLVTRAVTDTGIEVRRELSEVTTEAGCQLALDVTWRNASSAAYTGGLWVGVHDVLPEATSRYDAAMRPFAYIADDLDYRDDLTALDAPDVVEGDVGFFGLADSYFALFAVPTADAGDVAATSDTRIAYAGVQRDGGVLAHGLHWVDTAVLAPGEARARHFEVFVGPKEISALRAVDPLLVEAIDMGFLGALAWPLLWFLRFIHGYAGGWGLSIIVLVLIVKALFFPLTQKGFKASQAMQEVQPELQALRDKYQDNPEELNRRTIALMSERGVNPVAGCLPMLLQMPVWFALYSVLLNATELYHEEFLYFRDLTAVDPYLASPMAVIGLMLAQQQLMPTGNMDPAQARILKLMPLIFGIFFFSFPAGLMVYIFMNMLLSIGQQWYIRRTFAATPDGSQHNDDDAS